MIPIDRFLCYALACLSLVGPGAGEQVRRPSAATAKKLARFDIEAEAQYGRTARAGRSIKHFVVLSEGDSISLFWAGNHTGLYARNHPGIAFYGMAKGGSWLARTSDGNDVVSRFEEDAKRSPDVVTLLIGANDITSVGPYARYKSVVDWENVLFRYADRWRARGAKFLIGTILPQCVSGSPATGNDLLVNQNRVVINNALRAEASKHFDGVIDYAADSLIGPDEAACDHHLYSGGLHPTDGTYRGSGGQGRMMRLYSEALDRLLSRNRLPGGEHHR